MVYTIHTRISEVEIVLTTHQQWLEEMWDLAHPPDVLVKNML